MLHCKDETISKVGSKVSHSPIIRCESGLEDISNVLDVLRIVRHEVYKVTTSQPLNINGHVFRRLCFCIRRGGKTVLARLVSGKL